MRQLISLYESRLPDRLVRVVYSLISKKHFIIIIDNGKLKTQEVTDYQHVLDFIQANEIYKNEHYNLNQYPQIDDF